MTRGTFVFFAALAASAMMPSAFAATSNATDSTDRRETENMKNTVDRLMMFSVAVSDMPAAKAFYVDKLGLKVVSDHRINDAHWWLSLTPPEGGANITLTTSHENMKPGAMKMYFATADVAEAHKELGSKGVKVNEIKDDLYGPGSGVKWFNLEDPDGNQLLLVQAPR